MQNIFSLDNKTAVVTGAVGLLGRQHCRALAEAGANVVATDLRSDACKALAEELSAGTKTNALGFGADITYPASLDALKIETLKQYGSIDVLVNNAAVDDVFHDSGVAIRFEDYSLESWQRSIGVNLTGAFLCCQIIGSEMARRGGGSIINIASTYGIVAPDQSIYRRADGTQAFYKSAAYSVSKAGVLALTRYLAAYWGGAGVRVNALSPGGVENAQDDYFIQNYSRRAPARRMATPHDYQGAIVFLASEASSYMTGANLVVDGGWTIW